MQESSYLMSNSTIMEYSTSRIYYGLGEEMDKSMEIWR